MEILTSEPTLLVVLVMGITELAKRIGLPVKFSPLFALIAAVAMNMGFELQGVENKELAIEGVKAGLIAAGLYSSVKTVAKKAQPTE